jgi:hypothetical protein
MSDMNTTEVSPDPQEKKRPGTEQPSEERGRKKSPSVSGDGNEMPPPTTASKNTSAPTSVSGDGNEMPPPPTVSKNTVAAPSIGGDGNEMPPPTTASKNTLAAPMKVSACNPLASIQAQNLLVPEKAERAIDSLDILELCQNKTARDEFKNTKLGPNLVTAMKDSLDSSVDINWKACRK